jgi:anion-transporting  ArsA/GET3 family ATPase
MLLDRRLLFVTGKGGVGRTTVAGALAAACAARGRRVLLAMIGRDARAPWALAGVETEAVDGEAALDQYLGLVLPAALQRRVVRSRVYRRFAGAAPGLRELMTLGKVAWEARRGAWDVVVVDGPPTGHALALLDMPAAAGESFAGLVRSETARIGRELADPAHTAVCLVTLAEELPAQEAEEALAALRARGLALGPLVVNRVHRAPVGPDEVPAAPPGAPALVTHALAAAREEASWAALNRRQLARLRASGAPLVELDEHIGGDLDAAGVAALGEAIARQGEGGR